MQKPTDSTDRQQTWAINGRFLTQRLTGVQRYAREIVAALDDILAQDASARLSMRLIAPPGADAPSLAKIEYCQTRAGKGHAWDQFVLPLYAGSGVLSLGNFGPALVRNSIVCIHDANVFLQPDSYSRAFGLAYRTLLPLVGRRAARIATVSQFSADMLVKFGVCTREKIFIAHNGHEHALRWDAKRGSTELIAKLKRPFILLLGSTAKHKNLEVVLKQAEGLDQAGIDIVVAGGASNIFAANETRPLRSNVRRVGYVTDDDLAALYAAALCLVFPSVTEGFGLPIVEAMARGCPVISSDAASLVEVGGDAALYVDPFDGDRWRETIVGLLKNEAQRTSMAVRGRQRAPLFSWKRSAQSYLEEILRLGRR